MGRSSAARIILECVVRLDLPDAELVAAEGIVTALLRTRATHDPATTAEAQLQRTLRTKTQMASRWSIVLGAEGLRFASVIDDKINAFNSNQADAVTISAPERAFIKLWRHQTPEFLQLLEYHWQNFKVAESAVPLKIWAMPDLSPDTKVVRARSKPLWQSIMKWSPEKNYYWLLRCIGTFVKNIKEQQVSGKKISLRASANKYRVNFKDASLHDQACVFAHFLPEWKAHLSNQQLQDILARFSKGYLQKELEEKVKSGSWSSVHGHTSASEKADQASEAREVAELNLTKLKLDSEVAQYVEHKRQLRSFHARLREDKVAANLEYTQALDKATTEFAEKRLPCRKIAAAGVLTYVHELTTSWTESQGFQKAKVLQLYIASFDMTSLVITGNQIRHLPWR